MSTETAIKFSDGEIGLSFPDLDDEVESWLLRKYKHMAKYFWSGDIPACNAARCLSSTGAGRATCGSSQF